MTKQEIVEAMQDSRAKLQQAISGLDDTAVHEPGVVGDWSLRDILAHLTRWEAELVRLLFQLKQGQEPDFPTLTNPDFDAINARFQKESAGRSLELIRVDFTNVRIQTQRRLAEFTEKEINEPNVFPALKGNSLFAYIAENTFKHENEHTAQIIAWRNSRQD